MEKYYYGVPMVDYGIPTVEWGVCGYNIFIYNI